MLKTCQQCVIQFNTYSKEAKFCSRKCKISFYTLSTTVNCAQCNKAISVRPSNVKERNYCSRKCSHKGEGFVSRKRVLIKCTHCQNLFETQKSLENIKRYCSMKCRRNAHPSALKKCLTCKSQFTATWRRKNVKYCSKPCAITGRVKLQTGKPSKARRTSVRQCEYCNTEFQCIPSYQKRFCSQICRNNNKAATPPTKKQVEDLYLKKALTLEQVGEVFGRSNSAAKRWLRIYNIPVQSQSRRRGIIPPTKEELFELVHVKHISTQALGSRFGCDKQTIRGWIKKYGIAAPTVSATRTKGRADGITKEELTRLYLTDRLSVNEIARYYGVSGTCIIGHLSQFNIETRPSGWGEKHKTALGYTVLSIYEKRVSDWLIKNGIDHEYEPQLPFNKRMKADFSAKGFYIEIWGVTNQPSYEHRRARKIELYKTNNCKLIEIFPFSFDRQSSWKDILKKHLL